MALSLTNLITISLDKNTEISKELSVYKNRKTRNSIERRYTLILCNAYELYLQKRYKEAAETFEKAAAITDNRPLSYRGTMTAYNCAIAVYEKLGDAKKIKTTIFKALEIARKNKSYDYISCLYRDLSQMYFNNGDTVQGKNYEYLYLKQKEELMNNGQLSSVQNVKFMRELGKVNDQVRTLSEHRRLQNILLLTSAIVLCVIGYLLFRLNKAYKNIQQKNLHLYNANLELLEREAKAKALRSRQIENKRESAKAEPPATTETKSETSSYTTDNTPGDTEGNLKDNTADINESNAENPANQEATSAEKTRYQGSNLPDDFLKALYSRILHTMETSEEIYSLGLNIDKFSELLNTRSRYVSQAINQEYGSNFNALLNDYRIKEACRRLNDNGKYANMTIGAIAESVGFKSRTSFCALFKSITGLSPSSYQKMARQHSQGKNDGESGCQE